MSIEQLQLVAEQVLARVPALQGRGEEATKQALILPMLHALGYDIWNPAEVCPEYEADFAIKKLGQKEKTDIAILLSGQPRVYFEVKPVDVALDGHEGQLARYYNATTSVTLGVLTNGLEWRFFTDTGEPNIMDSRPFHTTRLDASDQALDVMARFAKNVFSAEAIREYASELFYTSSIATFLKQELDLRDREPSEQFIRWILKSDGMYPGTVNGNVVERFRPYIKTALARVLRDIVRRSVAAMNEHAAETETPVAQPLEPLAATPNAQDYTATEDTRSTVVTTERELECFAVLKEMFDKSVFANATIYDTSARKEASIGFGYKDTTGYFGVFFNKPSWWVARVVIEARKPWIGFDLDPATAAGMVPAEMSVMDPSPYARFRVCIREPNDLFKLNRVFLAAMEKVVADHRPEKGVTSQQPETAGNV